MKHIIIIFICLFSFIEANSQSYYLYNGNRVDLISSTDRIAVVLNTGSESDETNERFINNTFSDLSELKKADENVYLLKLRTDKPVSEIQNIVNASFSSSSRIKFATQVYYGQSPKVSQIPTDEFIVRLRSSSDKNNLDIINLRYNVRIKGNVSDDKGFLLKSSDGVRLNALELSDIYFNTGLFEYAEPNFIYPEFCILNSIPNDPMFPKQWSLRNTGQLVSTGGTLFGDVSSVNGFPGADIDADLAWDITTGSPSIKIGIFDTGIDSTHPDLRQAGHLLAGYDAFFDKYGVPKDSGNFGGHGTCAAGLAGAVSNNGVGVAGVAPGCMLMAFRIFNMTGSTTTIGIARAFDTARVRGIDVLSNSWNGFTEVSTLTNAINNAALDGRSGLGCVILFSAGNDGRGVPWYPSYLPNVLSVGASTNFDQKKSPGTGNQFSWGSNYGANENGDLDLVAPTICYTTDIQGAFGYNNTPGPEGDYFASFSGTSVSCPITAGVAALMLSVNPSLSRIEVMEKLCRGTEKIDNSDYSITKSFGKWNHYLGYGRVNAYNSVQLALGIDVTPPTIDHKNVSSHYSTYPTKITAIITDQDGSSVPADGINSPKLFYRLKKSGSGWSGFDSLAAVTVTGNEFSFKIPCQGYETQVQYYINAFDNAGNKSMFPRGAPDSTWLCYFAIGDPVEKSQTIGPFACLDGGNVTLSSSVAFDDFYVTDAKVQIFMQHERVSDAMIYLYSPLNDPNRNRKCLFASNGNNGSGISGAIVYDNASTYWQEGTPPYFYGVFRGDYFLNGLNGTSALGLWKIMHYDQRFGFTAAYDSVIINLRGTSGLLSSSAILNSERDSVLEFGDVNYPDSVVRDFYLKNAGTSDLLISSINFTGTSGSNFSLNDTLSGPIAPGDSGRISIKLKTKLSGNTGSGILLSGSVEDAVLEISNNDPSKPVFRVSLQTDSGVPEVRTLQLKALIQGFYNPVTDSMKGDTVRLFARSFSSPYSILDSATGFLDPTGTGHFVFLNIEDSIPIRLQIIHRNSLETWTSTSLSFSGDTLSYNMTDQSAKAYGDNLVLVNSVLGRYAMFSGDVNHDGIIDITDMMDIDNDVYNYASGYKVTDVSGDGFVDLTDAVIAGNNAENYIVRIIP